MGRKEVVKQINNLFIMTRFQYLIMFKNGSYQTFNINQSNKVKKLNDYTVNRHLNGIATLGVFSGKEFTKFITFDVDVKNELLSKWIVYKLINGLINIGISDDYIYVSTSGNKGYHVDIYFDHPIKNIVAKKLYLIVLNKNDLLNINCGQIEFRPNQLKQGVKLPLGINFKTNNRCWYCDNTTLHKIKNEEYILSIKQIDVEKIYNILHEQDDLYETDTVTDVESTRNAIESKIKALDSYKQNVDPAETIDSIKKILFNGLQIPGTRNNSLFKLAKYFHYQGLEREECKQMLIEWMEKQDESTYTTKWEDCLKEIDHIYNYVYDNDVQLTVKEKNLTVTYDEMLPIIKLKTKNEKILAYCLLIHSKRFSNAKDVFYMSYNQMSIASRMSLITTKRIIPKLVENGFLNIVQHNKSQKGTYIKKPNKYKLNYYHIGDCNKSFIFSCDGLYYADSFSNTLTHIFTNTQLHIYLPRRQYQSLIK